MGNSLINDEFPLPQVRDPQYWGENFVAVFQDPGTGIGGLFSIGRWVIQSNLWRNMTYLSMPNDRVYTSKNMAPGVDPKIPNSGLFKLEVLEPGRKLRYTFDGPMDDRNMTDLNVRGQYLAPSTHVKFDLIFESDAPIWDMHAQLDGSHNTNQAAANFNSPDGHIEQNGVVTGTITLPNGEVYSINAPATRDHSRGIRDLSRYKGHIWANGIFPSGRSFNLFTMKTQGFEGVAAGRSGAVVDGKLHEIKLREDTDGWLNSHGDLFRPMTLTFESDTLGTIKAHARKLVNSVPMILQFPCDHHWSTPVGANDKSFTWINEQKIVWEWDGEEGLGHLERGNRALSVQDPDWVANFQR